METAYTFDDVMFEPQYSDILSRKEVTLASTVGNLSLPFPLVSANMADITEDAMVLSMYESGGLGIMHRFMTIEENVDMFRKCFYVHKVPVAGIGVSVGVGDDEKERFSALLKAGAKVFCIDVAHGHHIHVKLMLEWISETDEYKSNELTIIAGNVASVQGAKDLHKWGAHVIKVGVGGGSCCQTRENTGVGIPQLSILKDIRESFGDCPPSVIADGGIKKTGDIGKALVYADAIMVGGFLAGTSETPGKVYETMKGEFYKTMAGSASAEAKVKHGKKQEFVEGGIRQVPFRGHVKYILQKAKENVRSTLSYSGARNLEEFRSKCNLVKISGGGKKESKF